MDVAQGALGPYRVLDLSDEKGFLCGKILGDLGCDVIKVEPPRGQHSRNIGPFFGGKPHPEKSLHWFAYNTNKRGITLSLDAHRGRELFLELAASADFVVESFAPGYLDKVGLGYSVLSRTNPRLVLVSITPFGQEGPYRDWKGPDLIAMALGGLTYISGDVDRPPVRISYPQSHLLAGAYGAVGAMVAHHHRQATGEGQQVDVSMQECCVWTSFHAPEYWDLDRRALKRAGQYRTFGRDALMRIVYPCSDGFITAYIAGGAAVPKGFDDLLEWMDREGMLGPLKGFDFRSWDAWSSTPEQTRLISDVLAAFFRTKTKGEIFQAALKYGFFAAPVSDARDLWENPQLRARDFWVELEHPELGISIPYPGAFVSMSRTPIRLRRRAPLIGEHNQEVYQAELGLSSQELRRLQAEGVI